MDGVAVSPTSCSVSWIDGGKPIAFVEYQGEPPTEHSVHGNAKTTDHRYVRTQPQVMDAVRQKVVDRQISPRKAYEQLVSTNDSLCAPRDHKVVKNMAHDARNIAKMFDCRN